VRSPQHTRSLFEIKFHVNIVCVNPSTNVTVLILALAAHSANGEKGEWEKMTAASVPTDTFRVQKALVSNPITCNCF
jgi:hypothetical protein